MLIQELQDEFIKVRVPTVDHDGELGDTVTVDLPEVNVNNEALRIVERKTEAFGPTERKQLTLSSRNKTDEAGDKWKRDAQRFNTAFQGASVAVMGGGGRGPVEPDNDYVEVFRHPNTQFVNTAEMYVAGLPYRTFHKGAGAGAGIIQNEIPFDQKTAEGVEDTFTFSMNYPDVSGSEFDPVLYNEGDGEGDWTEGTAVTNGNSSVTHETTADSLDVTSVASDDGSGDPAFTGDGNWSYGSKIDLSDWNTVEIEWAANFDASSSGDCRVRVMVGGAVNDSAGTNEAALTRDETSDAGGFARATATLDVSGVGSRELVRVAAVAETDSGDVDSTTDLNIYRVEVQE